MNKGKIVLDRLGNLAGQQLEYCPMPKYQPCSICGSNSHRVLKLTTGAQYHCYKHGKFLIYRP